MEVGLGPGDIVLDGAQFHPVKRATVPQFSAHIYCGQKAGWIKMPLGTEIGLGAGDIVLDGARSPPKNVAQPQIFGPCLLWPNGRPSQLLLSSCLLFSFSYENLLVIVLVNLTQSF